jgi:hypothetical protein
VMALGRQVEFPRQRDLEPPHHAHRMETAQVGNLASNFLAAYCSRRRSASTGTDAVATHLDHDFATIVKACATCAIEGGQRNRLDGQKCGFRSDSRRASPPARTNGCGGGTAFCRWLSSDPFRREQVHARGQYLP